MACRLEALLRCHRSVSNCRRRGWNSSIVQPWFPSYDRIIRGNTDAEVVARTVDYLKTVRAEDGIRPALVAEIRARVTEAPLSKN